MSENRLAGRVALVMGAGTTAGGIGNGKACAMTYARAGARLLAVDIDRQAVATTRAAIEAEGGECIDLVADVSTSAGCKAAADARTSAWGRIDIPVCAASKGAVNALTMELGNKYGAKEIRTNAIVVGLIKSPVVPMHNLNLYGGDAEKMWKVRDAMSANGRQGEPWEVAKAVLFLASDDSSYVNGVCLPVDGGTINLIPLS